MATLRRAGLRALSIDGTRYDIVGNIGYSLGKEVLEELIGADRFHGHKVTPGLPLMEFEVRDSGDLDVEALVTLQDVTVTAELVSGKTVILRKASQAGPGNQGSEEGAIELRFVGSSAEELIAN